MIKRKDIKSLENVELGVPSEPDAYLWRKDVNGIAQVPYQFSSDFSKFYCQNTFLI